MDKTTMVLTIDLPHDLGVRLNRATRRHADLSLRDITLDALAQWLDRNEERDASAGAAVDR